MPKTLFDNFYDLVDKVGKFLNLESWIIEELKTPKQIIIRKFSVPMQNGRRKTFTVYCVKYNDVRGVFKGGIRALFLKDCQLLLSTLKLLGGDMTLKPAIVNLPFGGAKTWLNADPKDPYIKKNWERIIKRMVLAFEHPVVRLIWNTPYCGPTAAKIFQKVFHLDSVIGPEEYVPAPDVGTGSQEMAWILDAYQQLHQEACSWGVVTGKPLKLHGSEGREIATSRGGQFVLKQAMRDAIKHGLPLSSIKGLKIVIQGFGKVGYHFANLIKEDGAKVIVVSDSRGGIHNPNGLDVAAVKAHKDRTGSVINFEGVQNITNDDLLELGCDVLVLAAKEGVITLDNAARVRAKIILELANSPVVPEADEILIRKGIFILPDILANAGGVTVSYYEWVQNMSHDQWRFPDVDEKLEYTMNTATARILKTAEEYKVSNRMAAYIAAISDLAEVLRLRGQYKLK